MSKEKTSSYTPARGWENKYLSWLIQFMEAAGMGTVEMSEKLGIPRQSLTYTLKSDNMALSKAQDMMDTLGYKLQLSYSKETPEETSPEEENDQKVIFVGFKKVNDYDHKRLAFLHAAMETYKFTITDIANRLELTYNAAQKALSKDDWSFMRLTQIATAFGLKLNVKITLKTN